MASTLPAFLSVPQAIAWIIRPDEIYVQGFNDESPRADGVATPWSMSEFFFRLQRDLPKGGLVRVGGLIGKQGGLGAGFWFEDAKSKLEAAIARGSVSVFGRRDADSGMEQVSGPDLADLKLVDLNGGDGRPKPTVVPRGFPAVGGPRWSDLKISANDLLKAFPFPRQPTEGREAVAHTILQFLRENLPTEGWKKDCAKAATRKACRPYHATSFEQAWKQLDASLKFPPHRPRKVVAGNASKKA